MQAKKLVPYQGLLFPDQDCVDVHCWPKQLYIIVEKICSLDFKGDKGALRGRSCIPMHVVVPIVV